ncbi:MAG: N-acetylmuramoyl-L-alanine amidase [Bacteriovoracaceae bacterium]|nr:N-acetylmuramoyl-L-alanine amidase [Bacteriovoracaceae bacterium]
MISIKTVLSIFVLFLLAQKSFGYTVLIDPGHGGEDGGASGHYFIKTRSGKSKRILVQEKDLVLQISKKVYSRLKQKRYKVFLTRSIDRSVTLQGRADIAEKVQADLFISIHLNSAFSKSASGIETYYLDNHTDAAVRKVEEVENRMLKGEDLTIQQILIDLVVERTAKTSRSLATTVHNKLISEVAIPYKMKDRKVRAGVFYVLALAKRPAVLLEAGFMSNEKELYKMTTKNFQKKFANAVVEGIDRFMLHKHKNQPILF